MRFTERVIYIACDRCDTRVLEDEQPHGWLIAQTALSESPAATVTYHLCPACREDLGTFMANEPQEDNRCQPCLSGEHGTVEDGICVCCRDIVDESAFEAYRAERARLGL